MKSTYAFALQMFLNILYFQMTSTLQSNHLLGSNCRSNISFNLFMKFDKIFYLLGLHIQSNLFFLDFYFSILLLIYL